ncbi:MAG TPA: hypothetical protein VHN80_28510, partial [Kineosporiaceae bacterium]|nr:hypothetical protein [Kineosporiaceae bacterium]
MAELLRRNPRPPDLAQTRTVRGFRIVGAQALPVRQDNRHWSSVLVAKVGWVAFKRSRNLPDAKSYRVRRDRAGRWHIAFTAIPDPVPAPGTGQVVDPRRAGPQRAAEDRTGPGHPEG